MYEQLRTLKSNEDALGQLATKLNMVADLLKLNDPVLRKLSGTEGTFIP
jgi:hypothetical protein